jgi:hypothetical protein
MIQIYSGYQIKPVKETPTLYHVVTDGKGGKIPNVLDSMFTTRQYAKDAIDSYLESKKKAE